MDGFVCVLGDMDNIEDIEGIQEVCCNRVVVWVLLC